MIALWWSCRRRATPMRHDDQKRAPLELSGIAVGVDVLVNIDVDDLARATEFYCAAFDLEIGRRLGDSVIELRGASSAMYLVKAASGTAVSPSVSQRRAYDRHWTPVHLDFVVTDIEPALDRARAAGARLEGDIRTHEWGRIAVMADPFGHGFCLLEFRNRGYDEIAQ
jgi:lactoylglutathione lyase